MHLGGGTQVLDAAVGARADEDGVDLDLAHRGAGLETHVLQGLLGGDLVALVLEVRRARARWRRAGTPWPGLVPQVTNGVIVEASSTISSSKIASSSVTRVFQCSTAASQSAPFGASGGPRRSRTWSGPGAIRPALAPHSIDMLQIVIRASIESSSMAWPRYSTM